MIENLYYKYDTIISNSLYFTLLHCKENNNILLINEKEYNKYKDYYNSILKILFSIYNYNNNISVRFYNSSIFFRLCFLKKFKKNVIIKLSNIDKKETIKVWNLEEYMQDDVKYFYDIWKEYYQK